MRAISIKRKPGKETQVTLKQSKKVFVGVTIAVLLFACTNKSTSNRNEQLAGMYKLYNIQVQDSAGVYHDEWASDGTGYIVYDGKGHMAVQITPKGYSEFKWVLTEGESINREKVKAKIDSMSVNQLKAALGEFVSNYVYAGNYSISDSANIIFHHRLSHTIPSAWNTSVKRRFVFNGDTLELYVDTDKRRLKWVKQQ
jgi:Lipocalin-like domain